MKVKVWQENVVIPTYEIGQAEKNPMFLEKRVYQGSSGVVYPYPVVEKIGDKAVDKSYNALYIENEYVKIMILPEIGGRVQMAYDKIQQRHFIYYNHVIKPALVGLTGPWISGGIEINWPQHHRPSTFLPIDFTIEELEDGGATVWVSERERMFHQKGMAGYTLRPGKAFLEIKGQLYNPTPIPQTFLWWANPAVVANDYHQSVFPPDVNAVFDHGKRDVSTFPIATGTYYKMDYSAGVDISRYKNIPVPTSYMAVKSKYDFVGSYEHDSKAGVLHYSNHNVSTGKKQWTWGCGDFGKAWDRNLTDNDGPYIELMTGMYCDNQPDFSWLQPYEEKTFTQYFIPYRELGVVKNASRDIMLNIEQDDDCGILKLFGTSRQDVRVKIMLGTKYIFDETIVLTPEEVFESKIKGVSQINDCKIWIYNNDGKVVLKWEAENIKNKEVPSPAKPALAPGDIKTTEQLFLTGQHIEQYRHATYVASDYYLEALGREPEDIRNNNAMGLLLLRKGKFAEAERYLQRAVNTQLERNPNPYDGEPLYNLGLSQKLQGKDKEAYESLYKSCWNGAWQDSGYFTLAQISAGNGEYENALYELDMSLKRNWHNLMARHLKVLILRKLGRKDEALTLIEESLAQDKFNIGCLFEKYLIDGNLNNFSKIMRSECHNYEELALDYLKAKQCTECVAVLDLAIQNASKISPMVYYYKGYAQMLIGNKELAKETFNIAMTICPDYCYPNTLESVLALEMAININSKDSKALYYIGNYWYAKRCHIQAIDCWERSIKIDDTFPTVLRNLSLAYYNKLNKKEEALELLERAFILDTTDARLFMELDQLHKRFNFDHQKRLDNLNKYKNLVESRDDLYLEYATLLNQLGRYSEAKEMIDNRKFHPWEGGEGKVPAQYQIAREELAKQAIIENKFADAISLLEECYYYPDNLGEGKLQGAQENDFNYYMGCAYEGLGNTEKAIEYFRNASNGISEPCDTMYYNDQRPDKIFYQGLALIKLDNKEEAEIRFKRLISYGEKHLNDIMELDYFAVSLPDILIWEADMNTRNKVHCYYMMALGYSGIGNIKQADENYNNVLELDVNKQVYRK
ncbi:MAG: DUF5107 domain-containing protein [Muribaculaceae bacterium]